MKILVTGDSWAAGDFNDTVSSTSLAVNPILVSLLEKDGHSVIHLPHPGESDFPSLYEIKKFNNNVDCIIFFKTQVSRLILSENLSEKHYNDVKGQDWPTFKEYNSNFQNLNTKFNDEMFYFGFIGIRNVLLREFEKQKNLDDIFFKINQEKVYKELHKYSQKLLLIGGLEKIKTNYKFNYLIEDLIKFLTGYKNDIYTLSINEAFEEFYKILKDSNVNSKTKNNLLKEIISVTDNTDKLLNIFKKNKVFFGPLDNTHPNETAINLYYHELIKPKLEEINDYRTTL